MNPSMQAATYRHAGKAMEDAATANQLADVFDVQPRQGRRYRDGLHPSWLTEAVETMERIHENGGDLWRIVSHLMSAAKRITLRGKSTADLVERWVELTDLEHDLEAEENRCIATWDGASEEITADEREARIQLERAAVRFLLQLKHINPRDYRRD